MSLFETIRRHIKKHCNINAHYSRLDYPSRLWVKLLCDFVEARLQKLEERLENYESGSDVRQDGE